MNLEKKNRNLVLLSKWNALKESLYRNWLKPLNLRRPYRYFKRGEKDHNNSKLLENLWIILTCFIFIRLGYYVIICRTWYFNARSLAIIYVMFLAQEVDGHFMLCSMQQDFIYWKHIRKYNKTFNTENTTYNTARLALKINQTYHRCSCTKKITENKIAFSVLFQYKNSCESLWCVLNAEVLWKFLLCLCNKFCESFSCFF